MPECKRIAFKQNHLKHLVISLYARLYLINHRRSRIPCYLILSSLRLKVSIEGSFFEKMSLQEMWSFSLEIAFTQARELKIHETP